ncbi:transmembrane protein 179B-like [Leucoraja erinacea]|uniref:transmembrane protein 179B-like n=1 Tax=Leucoraja erinaceus TaxID=7782 RepID=UPI0024590B70|nr:transmembrane protein 179B-like [Leucoraja erinacea]
MACSPLLFLELLLYGAAFICGIVTAALVTVTQGEFGGVCILYGVSQMNGSTRSLRIAAPGSASHCAFVDVASVLIAVYCFCTAFYFIYAYFLEENTRSTRCLKGCLAISAVFLLLLLTCGCLIRVGFSTFCRSVMDQAAVKRCSEAGDVKLDVSHPWLQVPSKLHQCTTATWVNFFLWVVIVCLLLVQWRRGRNVQLSTAVPGGASTPGRVSETDHLIPSGPRP